MYPPSVSANVVEVLLGLRLRYLLHHALQVQQLRPPLLHEPGEHLLGGLRLAIPLKIFGGILLRRQAHIQRDHPLGAALLVVILRLQPRHAPLHAVEVSGYQLTVYPQLVPIQRLLIFLLLHGQLAPQAIPRVGSSLQQILSLLPNPIRLLPLRKKVVQQRRKALCSGTLAGVFILYYRCKGKVKGAAAPLERHRQEISPPH